MLPIFAPFFCTSAHVRCHVEYMSEKYIMETLIMHVLSCLLSLTSYICPKDLIAFEYNLLD